MDALLTAIWLEADYQAAIKADWCRATMTRRDWRGPGSWVHRSEKARKRSMDRAAAMRAAGYR